MIAAPSSATAGGTIGVSDTTKNQGGGAAAASTTRFYWSTNTSIDASDQFIGVRSAGALAAGISGSGTTTLSVPAGAAAGLYYVIAQADGPGEVLETTENNNTRASAAVKVGPDLIVSAHVGSGHRRRRRDDCGDREHEKPGRRARRRRRPPVSTCRRIRPLERSDPFIGSRTIGQLAAGATSTAVVMLQIPPDTASGAYYVIARADWNSGVVESTESNNDRSSGAIRIGADLVVSSLSAPATLTLGASVTVTDSTRNQGLGPAPESATAFYLSTNGSYSADDRLIGSRIVPALDPR